DLSIDSLDLSCEEGTPLSITRSGGSLPPYVCLWSACCLSGCILVR
nr:NuMA protein - human [Homo sapiens]